jgi:predicted nuclease of predicted toxin-antitoxin system
MSAPALLARWLKQQGHDVFSVYDQARGIGDDMVIEIAQIERRILITNDRGFGDKVFRERRPHHGVVFVRLAEERAVHNIRVLDQLISQQKDALSDRFVVATESRVRFAGK